MTPYVIDRSHWKSMAIFEQMGNIYSEVGRSLKAKREGNALDSQEAMIRALDLFDATTEVLITQKSPRAREVLRAKDQYLELFYGDADDRFATQLEMYFMQFAVAARLRR